MSFKVYWGLNQSVKAFLERPVDVDPDPVDPVDPNPGEGGSGDESSEEWRKVYALDDYYIPTDVVVGTVVDYRMESYMDYIWFETWVVEFNGTNGCEGRYEFESGLITDYGELYREMMVSSEDVNGTCAWFEGLGGVVFDVETGARLPRPGWKKNRTVVTVPYNYDYGWLKNAIEQNAFGGNEDVPSVGGDFILFGNGSVTDAIIPMFDEGRDIYDDFADCFNAGFFIFVDPERTGLSRDDYSNVEDYLAALLDGTDLSMYCDQEYVQDSIAPGVFIIDAYSMLFPRETLKKDVSEEDYEWLRRHVLDDVRLVANEDKFFMQFSTDLEVFVEYSVIEALAQYIEATNYDDYCMMVPIGDSESEPVFMVDGCEQFLEYFRPGDFVAVSQDCFEVVNRFQDRWIERLGGGGDE